MLAYYYNIVHSVEVVPRDRRGRCGLTHLLPFSRERVVVQRGGLVILDITKHEPEKADSGPCVYNVR